MECMNNSCVISWVCLYCCAKFFFFPLIIHIRIYWHLQSTTHLLNCPYSDACGAAVGDRTADGDVDSDGQEGQQYLAITVFKNNNSGPLGKKKLQTFSFSMYISYSLSKKLDKH